MTAIYDTPIRFWFASLWGGLVSGFIAWIINIRENRRLKRRIVFSIGAALLIGGILATAQDASGAGDGAAVVSANPDAAVDVVQKVPSIAKLTSGIAQAVDASITGLAQNSTIRGMGNVLLAFGLFIGMLWASIKTMVGGKGLGELIGEWTPLFVSFGVVTALIDPAYGGAPQIVQTMDKIGSAIAGGVDVSSASALMPSVADKIFRSIQAVIDMPTSTSPSLGDVLTGGVLTMALATLGVFLLKIGVIFLIIIAGCVYISTAIMAMLSIHLVLGLAPVMVPFLIFRPLAWIFDSWLRFLLGACMMKIVGAFMLNMTSSMLVKMTEVATMVKADSAGSNMGTLTADLVLYSALLLLAVMAGLLMAQVPSIATGLMSGSAGGAGFSGVKGVTQGLGARAGSAAASNASSAAYNRTIGRRLAANQGRSDAQANLPANVARYKDNAMHRAYVSAHTQTRKAASPSN